MSALLALLLGTYPNSDRVQRILTDDWLATGGKGSTVPRR